MKSSVQQVSFETGDAFRIANTVFRGLILVEHSNANHVTLRGRQALVIELEGFIPVRVQRFLDDLSLETSFRI